MDQDGQIQSEVYAEQYSQVRSFVENLTYYQVLSSCAKLVEREFFETACDALVGTATLAWCNVFVDIKSHVYWSKLIENMPEELKQDFTHRVCKITDLTEDQYQEYKRSIKKLRDKYVAHIDPDWQASVPLDLSFDKALRIAIEYECWLNDLLPKEGSFTRGDVSLNDIIKSATNEVEHLAAIVAAQKRCICIRSRSSNASVLT